MITVCRKCLPGAYRSIAMVLSGYRESYECNICELDQHWTNLFEVNTTAEDIRFANWVHEFERGVRE